MSRWRLSDLPAPARLALGGFVVLILGFQVVAQANLWVRDGEGSLPGPRQILRKYHGDATRTKLHRVLDPSLPETDPHAMWPYLGRTAAEQTARRALVLQWAEDGAPRVRWPEVERIFTGFDTCAQCHLKGGSKGDLPLQTYENVLAVARPDRGIGTGALLVSAHNHLYAFAALALVLSLAVTFCPGAGPLRAPIVVLAFAGAGLDVASWFLTRAHGWPWPYGVLAGGGAFGVATGAMAACVFDEVAFRGRVLGGLLGLLRRRVPDA